jgi:glycosyltransferase involved in cell wall biosynthesis
VVQVLLNLGKGGMETMAVNLACRADRARFRVVLLALDAGGEHESILAAANVEYHVLGGRRPFAPGFHWRVVSLLRRLETSVLHTHHFAPLLHVLPGATLAGVSRVVHTEHSYRYLEPRRDYRRALRWASRRCDVFVVVAESMASYYRDAVGVAARRVRVIPNGIDVRRFQPTDRASARARLGLPPGPLFGTAGRLFPEKRPQDLLEALARVRRTVPDAHLVFVGDGPERPQLTRLASSLGLTGAVTFAGWQTDQAPWLAALDAFLLPSETEGLPLAVLEAMASGTPVVTTPVGDLPRVVRPGRDGLHVPVADIEALAAAMLRLAGDPGLRAQMGQSARESVVAQYDEALMVERYQELYAA